MRRHAGGNIRPSSGGEGRKPCFYLIYIMYMYKHMNIVNYSRKYNGSDENKEREEEGVVEENQGNFKDCGLPENLEGVLDQEKFTLEEQSEDERQTPLNMFAE